MGCCSSRCNRAYKAKQGESKEGDKELIDDDTSGHQDAPIQNMVGKLASLSSQVGNKVVESYKEISHALHDKLERARMGGHAEHANEDAASQSSSSSDSENSLKLVVDDEDDLSRCMKRCIVHICKNMDRRILKHWRALQAWPVFSIMEGASVKKNHGCGFY